MNLSPAQTAVFKAWLQTNAAGLSDDDAAALANQIASPSYYVHRHNVQRVEVYKGTVLAADSSSGVITTWSWQGYKAQASPEQDAWKEMYMGGGADFGLLTNRQGIQDIFGNTGLSGANRIHIFNIARRKCTNFEKLYVVAVSNPPANTGNVSTDVRGAVTNPDTLGIGSDGLAIVGPVTFRDISIVRAS